MPRDKFAAMASRAAAPSPNADSDGATGDGAAVSSTSIVGNAPVDSTNENSADQLSLTHQQQQQQGTQGDNSSSPSSSALAMRRDKLAALAAKDAGTDPTRATAASPAVPSTGRGNKLAALSAASSAASHSAIAGRAQTATSTDARGHHNDSTSIASAAEKREQQLAKLKERLSKRKDVLDNLDKAEALTCNLLQIASKTTNTLQNFNGNPEMLSELSEEYRSTLQKIHPLLTNGTDDLIKPYQNHTMETKQGMYAARVEMRLARERFEVLKTFSELEKEERQKVEHKSEETVGRMDDAETQNSRKRQRKGD